MTAAAIPSEDDLIISNYCVSFIDLLGQRAALQGQSLIPTFQSEGDKQGWHRTIRDSIGSIVALQEHANEMIRASEPNPNSPLRSQLTADKQMIWDSMQQTRVTTQRWSDGLVSFASLSDTSVKCHLNNVYQLFAQAGSLAFIGLASKRPIRGAIEIAWAIELHPGELYGAALARAYELESEVAEYPRIVIGRKMVRFLDLQLKNPNQDPYAEVDRSLAGLCRDMVVQDADGHWLLHYLGPVFRDAISQESHIELYGKARAFVIEQLREHQQKQNTKLAFRYRHLLQYFDAHPPN